MEISIKIEGLAELAARWSRLPKKIQTMVNDALTSSGYLVEAESKKRTPVDTGRLRSSISIASSLRLRAQPHVIISPHTNYAIYVHEGTRHMRSRPFMTQGYDASKQRIRNIMKKMLKDITKQMK